MQTENLNSRHIWKFHQESRNPILLLPFPGAFRKISLKDLRTDLDLNPRPPAYWSRALPLSYLIICWWASVFHLSYHTSYPKWCINIWITWHIWKVQCMHLALHCRHSLNCQGFVIKFISKFHRTIFFFKRFIGTDEIWTPTCSLTHKHLTNWATRHSELAASFCMIYLNNWSSNKYPLVF